MGINRSGNENSRIILWEFKVVDLSTGSLPNIFVYFIDEYSVGFWGRKISELNGTDSLLSRMS